MAKRVRKPSSPVKRAKTAGTARSAKKANRKKKAKARKSTGIGAGSDKKRVPAASEPLEMKRKRAAEIVRALRKTYGPVTTALEHDSALTLLIATILSAQSTDETVNRLIPDLFAKYPDAKAFAKAPPAELEDAVRPSGFFRQKTKSIQGACRALLEHHGGEVPDSMESLVALPGVARKTANVVLGSWFGKNEGVVVDTHVGRLAERMGLTWSARNAKDAVKIEQDLMEVVPRRDWTDFGHLLIWHGRRYCKARKPDCEGCPVSELCPSAGRFA